jgi:addiction module HigA family antidote
MLNRNNKIKLTDAGETSAADILEETLQFHGIKQNEFALRVGISQKHLSQILNKKAFMSPELALKIEKVTGIPAKMMLRLDTNYELAHAAKPEEKPLDNDTTYLQAYEWAV